MSLLARIHRKREPALSRYRVSIRSSPRFVERRVYWTTVEAASHDEAVDKALPILWAMEDDWSAAQPTEGQERDDG